MTKELAIQLGQQIKEARLAKGMTQLELAKILGYETSQFVSLYEAGKSKVPLSTLGILCDILNLNRKKVINEILKDYKDQLLKQFAA